MDYTRVKEQFSYHHTEEINTAAPLVALNNALLPPYDDRWITSDPLTDLSDGSNFNDQEIFGISGTMNWDVSGFTVKSITAFRNMELSFGTDPDGSPITIIDEVDHNDVDQFSQEIQLSGNSFDDRFTGNRSLLSGRRRHRHHRLKGSQRPVSCSRGAPGSPGAAGPLSLSATAWIASAVPRWSWQSLQRDIRP
jgi:hypothetical protein